MAPLKSTIAGLILTGGKSSRMGQDKATLEIGDLPLWRIAIDILEPLTDKVILVGQIPSLANTAPYTMLADSPPGLGPLGGLATGLERSGYEHHLVLAVDYPLARPALFRLLLEQANQAKAVDQANAVDQADAVDQAKAVDQADAVDQTNAVCGRSRDHLEPLVAYYHASCADVIRAMIAENEIRTRKIFDRVKSRVLTAAEYDTVDPERLSQLNVNTPVELEHVRRLFPAHGGK
jgi:molybdopterin-guanine dinucleotide biosynthesis protein A